MLIKLTNTLNSIVRRVISIVKDGLKMWLRFESSGSDTSGNSNNATLYTGKALSFDGVNDYVDLGSQSNPATNMTFACWLNPIVSASTGLQSIIDYGRFLVQLDDNDTLVLYTNTSGVAVNYTISDLNNKWSRLVVSVSGTTTSVYIDGTLIAAKTTTALSDSASQSDIGRDGTTRYYEGKLSDLQIFDATWTQADVTFDYENPQHLVTDNSASSIALSNLKGYWHLIEGAGAINYDSSGENNDGSINGATWSLNQATIPQLGLMDWSKGSNLIPYSEDFSNSSWLAINSSKQSGFTSPTGLSTAFKITASANNGYIRWTGGININPPYTVSVSIFAKKGTTTKLRIQEQSHIGKQTTFDLDSGSIEAGGNTTSSKIEDYGNGWYRCSVTQTYTGASTSVVWAFILPTTGNLFLWGAQIEEASSLSAYRKTNGSTVIDATLISDPNDPSKDILDNTVRLREHSLNLDAIGYAQVDDNNSLDFGTSDFSYGFWFKVESGNTGFLFGVSTLGNSSGVGLTMDLSNGTIRSRPFGVAAIYTTSGYNDGGWHYAFHNIDRSGSAKLFIDNTEVLSQDISSESSTSLATTDWYVGAENGAGTFLNGLIDDVVIYNKLLSLDERTQNYNAGLNQHKTGSSFSDDFSSDYGL